MKVQVINKSQWELPKYETLFSAGMDVRGDFSRIKLVDSKPEKFFFDADAVGILEGKDKKKAIMIKASCGTRLVPFVAVYDNNKELIKAFYSEVGDCTTDNIIKYLNEVQ